jgi:DNA-binding response OmpR family regulator
MLELAREPDLHPFEADLRRIATAAKRFLTLLEDPFAGGKPSLPAPTAPAAEPPPEPPELRAAGHRGLVLIVDDNEDNRDMLARGLVRQQHDFALAADGKKALALLHAGRFDLVLLDIMMPEMDGFEVLRRMKADPALREVPVIMISALDEIAAVVRCIEMGAEDYLPKPFDPVLLRARVGACLEKKRLRDQELDYLRNVAVVTESATAVEAGTFDPDGLADVADRPDALGQLARVFQSMARKVRAREERLREQVQQLRIEIDESRKAHQVAEITETAFFEDLRKKAQALRDRSGRKRE